MVKQVKFGRFVGVIALLGMLVSFSACTSTEWPSSELNSLAILHMEEKYGESFTYAGATGESMASSHGLYLNAESMLDSKIKVVVTESPETREISFSDNYLFYKDADEITAFLENSISEVYPGAVVHYAPTDTVPEQELSVDATVDELLTDSGVVISILVEVPETSILTQEKCENAISVLSERKAKYIARFVSIPEDIIGTLNVAEINDSVENTVFDSILLTRL